MTRAAAAFVCVKVANTEIRRHWWWLTNNPRNPVVKYMIYRRSLRIAKELMVEINKDKHKLMLSTAYRLRLESICRCIANNEEVPLEDMIWAENLQKHILSPEIG